MGDEAARIASGEQRVEAARYAVLRRLAYAMRHHMVVHLQPIAMITEVLDRRLQAPAPDLAPVHDAMAKIQSHARAAVQSSIEIVAWLAPEPGKLVALDAGVQDCVELLRSQLNFRGFALRSEVATQPTQVSVSALRGVLPAALLALCDCAASPADVVLQARATDGWVRLVLDVRPTPGAPGFSGDSNYRLVAWADVEAIAAAEGARIAHGDGTVTIELKA